MDAPTLQKNFGLLSKQPDISVISRILEVAYNVLPVYLINIISFLDGVGYYIVIIFLSYDKKIN